MDIKALTLKLRKERSELAPVMQFHVAEIEKIGKNNGNRPTTDDEAINYVKKAIGACTLNMKLGDTERNSVWGYEKNLLESLLPKMATEDELRAFVEAQGDVHKGLIMKAVKAEFGALADMKFVSTLVS